MNVLIVAMIGIAVVLLSILVLRLHPIIGLLLASLFVLAATPEPIKLQNRLEKFRQPVAAVQGNSIGTLHAIGDGAYYHWPQGGPVQHSHEVSLRRQSTASTPEQTTALEYKDVAFWYSADAELASLKQGDSFVAVTAYESTRMTIWSGLGSQLADGFAQTFRRLGIPVTMAAIVGVCLIESGAATRLVMAIVALFGARGTAPALTVSGFILGIPVYFDNVFYLLLPLAKAIGRQKPAFFMTAVMAIIVGATMAHSLVPPTPGPLLVAAAMQVGVGTMILAGTIVGGVAATAGFGYGVLCKRWVQLSIDQLPQGESGEVPQSSIAVKRIPLSLAALPIGIPIAVLGSAEIVTFLAQDSDNAALQNASRWIDAINDPTLVFILTALLAIWILKTYGAPQGVRKAVSRGLADAGTIVLLTCAGGAFGASLQQLQLADAIGEQFQNFRTPWGLLLTAFFLTTIIRAAQGSATVAMVTSADIIAPVLETMELPFHPVYLALAIGCGSKPLPWMNDSGFWQVATMTGMSAGQTLKTFTAALTLMGIVGFIVTLLGAWLLPFK